jgi:hypothetical protein
MMLFDDDDEEDGSCSKIAASRQNTLEYNRR